MAVETPELTEIRLEKKRRELVVMFVDGSTFALPHAYLRTHSPSAEVRGHGYSEPRLLVDKDEVQITEISPVGNYAIQLTFDDGHNSGIYSWSFLYELGVNMEDNLQKYAERLKKAHDRAT